jgi:phosphohistidine phosphatase
MQVLLIRHAIAEELEDPNSSEQADAARPLSAKGKTKMRKNIEGLQLVLPQIYQIASSPLIRAQQTADLLLGSYRDAKRDTLRALAPRGSAPAILTYLQEHAHTTHTIALIGHEPDLGELGTWLLSGHTNNWMPLRKGAACLLEFTDEVLVGQASLVWSLNPSLLRRLARSAQAAD